MKYLLVVLFSLSGCVSLEYIDPDSNATLKYSSAWKSATDVQIVYTSPEKTVGVSIGSTQNDPVFEQIGEIIKSYNLREEL
jgi:hypothetical protein